MDSGRPPGRSRAPSVIPWVVVVLLLAAAVVGGVWWYRTQPPPVPLAVAPAVPPPSAPAAEAATGPSVDEAGQRALLDAVSASPAWRRLVAEGDLVRRWVVVTENLAEGTVPRKPLAALAPSGGFSVVQRGGASFIAPESYRRFDGFGDLVASVNVPAFAAAYRALRPMLETAYRALGYPGGSIDRVTARALARIERAPVRDGDVQVVEGKGAVHAYADPRLESLGELEKQFLRMGPRNARILQAKAREIAQALSLTAP